jgi:hypothetical protein
MERRRRLRGRDGPCPSGVAQINVDGSHLSGGKSPLGEAECIALLSIGSSSFTRGSAHW